MIQHPIKELANIKSTIILLSCFFSAVSFAQTESVLSSGQWVKMAFSEPGVYRISHNQLNELGFSPANLDPRNIAIYGNPGGMLPQSLSDSRPIDLVENAIMVSGQQDGIFNTEDYILFYVDDIDPISFSETTGSYITSKNLYSDQNFYFLTVKEELGKRLNSVQSLGANQPLIDWYNDIVYHETDQTNILNSGREWFGEQFTTQNVRSFSHTISNLASNQEVKVAVSVLSQSFISSSLDITLDGSLLGNLSFNSIPNSQYGIKGSLRSGNFSLATNQISQDNLDLTLTYEQNGANNAVAYLNSYSLDIPKTLQYDNRSIVIRNSSINNRSINTYQIQNASDQLLLWNITIPTSASDQSFSVSNGTLSFGAIVDASSRFILFDPSELPSPINFSALENQDLKSASSTDLIIITHSDFLEQAERLAAFRRSHDQLTVTVTTVDKIYNEYSSGRQDISAIRNFIKSKYGPTNDLKYVLLFGKGSYDFKNRVEINSNFVPTYESRNSIHPLLTYSSDDFFGFLDDNEGEWIESRAGDHTLDIGLGRIPITNVSQAKKAVDKIILYQTDKNAYGKWRSKLLFIADDGDNNRHQKDADSLATLIDTTFVNYNIEKIYLDAFEQVRLPNGEVSPSAEEALTSSINEGALIVNFTGHGSESGWMQERVLTFDLMAGWNNTFNLPFLVTATCEFGRNDDPSVYSGAENLLFKDVGGVISMVTTARPVVSRTNYDLSLALYNSVLAQNNGEYQRLGDIIKFTKNNSLRGSLNRNFILLGDPSMRLSYPQKSVVVTEINGNLPSVSDTIKALQHVSISGQILSADNLDPNFNGTLNFSLFDKPTSKETIGTESSVFAYEERDSELFRGTAKVVNGVFTVDFIVPKNIDYSFGSGKMNIYATSEEQNSDALGTSVDFVIGGTAENIIQDSDPPEIELFVNDTTVAIQPTYDTDITLILKLFDQSGINISNNGLGQNLSLTLNDSVTFNLNQNYEGALDNFRKGIAVFRLDNLPSGVNRITITAWDVHGNSSTKNQELNVIENTSSITVINNYPNPFSNETQFNIEHLLNDENLEVQIDILNLKGDVIRTINQEFLRASDQLSIPWDGTNYNDNKITAGLYIYSVRIYSKTSGKSDTKRQKLLISN